jgi:hypothetical protein
LCLHIIIFSYGFEFYGPVPRKLSEINPESLGDVAVALIISGRVSGDAQWRFIEDRALDWTMRLLGFVINSPITICINAHEAVPMVIHHGTVGLIYRDMRLRSTTRRF